MTNKSAKIDHIGSFPSTRLRRNRQSAAIRRLVRETELNPSQLILPIFIKENLSTPQAITSMPGHFQWPLSHLGEFVKTISAANLGGVMLFGIPAEKDAIGSAATTGESIVAKATTIIKDIDPNLLVIADLCFCEYTDHGHCGILNNQQLDNDATLPRLAEQAICLANAGVDMIAPSGMLDGMVAAIRQGLDRAGFQDMPIMSYAVKYASSLYGPFREAAEGAPQEGDRRGYQMDPANAAEALREARLDIHEGADIIMVKPALAYLDVIHTIKQTFPEVPLAAYHVSGEYAMVKAAAEKGWLDEGAVMKEHLTAIARAGAKIIITYAALEVVSD